MQPNALELENDSENLCLGCGPKNPVGLNLKFFKQDDTIFAEKIFNRFHTTWPGQVNSGLLFCALECTCQWTFYAMKGQIGPTERFDVNYQNSVFVEQPVRFIGRILARRNPLISIRAEAVQYGKVGASMNQDIRVVSSKAEFVKLRPTVTVDRVMERILPP